MWEIQASCRQLLVDSNLIAAAKGNGDATWEEFFFTLPWPEGT